MLGGDDHPQKALGGDEIHDVGRDFMVLVIDRPVVDHAAQLLDRAVQEGLLRLAEAVGAQLEQFGPVRVAREQLGVPPHRARVQRGALGLGDGREDLFHEPHEGFRENGASEADERVHGCAP
jgi:hypothetical protein